jgi:hypothetical protein
MALTINEIAEKLKQLDEIMLVELLNLNSNDLVNAFMDIVEEKADKLEGELDDN